MSLAEAILADIRMGLETLNYTLSTDDLQYDQNKDDLGIWYQKSGLKG